MKHGRAAKTSLGSWLVGALVILQGAVGGKLFVADMATPFLTFVQRLAFSWLARRRITPAV